MTSPISLYDTRSRQKRPFVPADPTNVRMYVCGPTVYDFAHIGNARPFLVFDVLFRVMRAHYGVDHVTYVRNITDVEDKINARAAERGISIDALTERTIKDFHEDVDALHCLRPTHEPHATAYIKEMCQMIDELVAKGHAYVEADHVLFSVASMPSYGSLSRRSLDEMIAGARVEVAPYKRDGLDFVLWKPSLNGEPGWQSPAGIAVPGRPGWHIECSAMSKALLGERFDIHGGGIDLAFPHHENERAQTTAACGTEEMASYWMHNGFLLVEGRKMSKSEGNFLTIRDALKAASGDALRLSMLMTQYRQPIDWTARRISEANAILKTWSDAAVGDADTPYDEGVFAALADDLNTPRAVSRISELAKRGEASIHQSAGLLGVDLARVKDAIRARAEVISPALKTHVEALIKERLTARAERRFADADKIRDDLAAEGVALKDGKDAAGQPVTTWSLKASGE
ncbi:MAG: cysteine--tRNA ligase [Pseudomonadota bacterium]